MKKTVTVIFIAFLFLPFVLHAGMKAEKSEIRFIARHKFKEIKGQCEEVKLNNLNVSFDNKASVKTPFEIIVPVVSITTGNSSRDSNMLDVIGYPQFREIRVIVATFRMEADGRYFISGTLFVNGQNKPFESRAAGEYKNGKLQLGGDFEISLDNYKIERPALLFIAVEDRVTIEYNFVFSG